MPSREIFVAGTDLPKDDVEEAFKTAIAVLSKSRYRAFIK